jgi:hypothetical protein
MDEKICTYLKVMELKNSSDRSKSPTSIIGSTPLLKSNAWPNIVEKVNRSLFLSSEMAGMMSWITSFPKG